MTIALIVMPLLAAAQETAVTTYVFRFRTGSAMLHRDMNAVALDSLSAVISGHREDILSGVMPLHVDGHAATPEAARIRSNRVKSEMIVRDGLTEDCFVTRNHSGGGDYVTVRISVPPSGKAEKKAEAVVRKEETAQQVVETVPEKDEPSGNRTVTYVQPQADKASQSIAGINSDSHRFALRANLLRWVTLTPDLGLEWRIHPSWGILVNGSWTSWSWNDKDRRYALWEVAPEVRYYIGKEKRGYLGAMFKAGQFNYKLSGTGRQGDLLGGGITGGYQLRLNDALSLDFSLALGYLNADYEKYEVIDGVRVRRGNETKDWWGPINAGVTSRHREGHRHRRLERPRRGRGHPCGVDSDDGRLYRHGDWCDPLAGLSFQSGQLYPCGV